MKKGEGKFANKCMKVYWKNRLNEYVRVQFLKEWVINIWIT